MQKLIASSLVAFTLFGAGIASAQTYYQTAGCLTGQGVTISRDLSVGSRGSDVSSLQTFLVAQNYPGSGSWMVTGYYGQATATAVRNFQSQRGLAQTGVVDASTRAALVNCGGSSVTPTYNYGTNYNTYTYPTNSWYPYNYTPTYTGNQNTYYGYNNYGYSSYAGAPTISSLSVTSAVTGASVTISGTNFDYNSNTVYVGSVPVTGIPSYSGSSLSFVVPQNVSGNVLVYVSNGRGSSNTLQLNVINYTGGTGCVYPYNTGYGTCGCSYVGCQSGQLSISSLSPDSGARGSTVTVYGTGFTTNGNTVHFGNGILTNINSPDGRAISFTVPTNLIGYNSQPVGLGTYPVSVTNAAGYTSNVVNYTVTSLGSASVPTINSITGPTSLSTNVAGTWTVNLSSPANSYATISVRWGDENLYSTQQAAAQTTYGGAQQAFTFSHAYLQTGTYTITFTVSTLGGQSNTSTATVTVSGTGSGSISLNAINPTSGRVGTQIALTGTGFTTYDNTVHFGIGGTQHLVSQNGTTLYFTVPSYISPCDVVTQGTYCALYAQQVTPGQYQVYVTNALGQTSQQTFTVTQ